MLVFLKLASAPRLTSDDDKVLCSEKFHDCDTLWTKVRGCCEECQMLHETISKLIERRSTGRKIQIAGGSEE